MDFRRRAYEFLNKLYDKSNRDKTIEIISHGGMINQLYALLLNSPIHTSAVFSTADTGIHVWRWDGH